MRLNTLKPARGSRRVPKRVGRGASAGQGKTGRPRHEGPALARPGAITRQVSRAGRCRCSGVCPRSDSSRGGRARALRVRVHELGRFADQSVDLAALKAAHLVPKHANRAKIFASGTLDAPVKVVGIAVTPGARKIIEAAGGSVE